MSPERWIYTVSLRLRSLFRRNRVEQDLDAELRDHLDRQIAENTARGMWPDEARIAALRNMDGTEFHKEECRDMRRANIFENLFRDLRFSLRTLRKNPRFAIVAILTLALGIGANTAVFSMVNALLFRPYDFPDLDGLVQVWENRGVDEGFEARWMAPADAENLRVANSVFERLTTYRWQDFNLSTESNIEPVL
jgi:hypothetical protein